MRHTLDFTFAKGEDTWERETLRYFQSLGFKAPQKSTGHLIFRRGSLWKNLFTFNPLAWKSRIDVMYDQRRVAVLVDITTTFQHVTSPEEALWEKCVENYQKSLETGNQVGLDTSQELKKVRKVTWMHIWYATQGGLIFAIPGAVFAYFTGLDTAVASFAAVGAFLFTMHKIKQEKKHTWTKE